MNLELTPKLAKKYECDIKLKNYDVNNWRFGSLTDDEIIKEVTVDEDQLEDDQNIISQQRSVTNNNAINVLNTVMTREK